MPRNEDLYHLSTFLTRNGCNLVMMTTDQTTKAFTIRQGTRDDAPQLLRLIKALADYEKGLHLVTNTTEQLIEDCFTHQLFDFIVAEYEGQTVGMAMWYYRYSSWRGKCLYLEDLYVDESYRQLGIGKALFKAVAEIAHAKQVAQMVWQVLDWNEPAIKFYNNAGAQVGGDDFVNAWLDKAALERYLAS